MTEKTMSHLTGKAGEPKYLSAAESLQRKVLEEAIRQREKAEEDLETALQAHGPMQAKIGELQGKLATEMSARLLAESRAAHLQESLTAERNARQVAEQRVTLLMQTPPVMADGGGKLVPYRIEIPQATGGKRIVRLIPEES